MSRHDDEHDAAQSATGSVDPFLHELARVTDVPLGTSATRLAPGTRLGAGRFEITRLVGAGGMGVVYEAHDHHRGYPVALKTLRAATPDGLRRLRGEFVTLHDLVHPNLVSLGELLDDGNGAYFTMELVDGVDFLAHVRPGDALDGARLRAACRQLADGLLFLHAVGTVHRDIKPHNVLVSGARVVLLDFGLATPIAGGESDSAGTVAYMAPEQAAGASVGPAADWYSVGVMLWQALTGWLPFTGDRQAVAEAKRRGPPAPPELATMADLARLAISLLEPDPARRPDGATIARVLGAAPPASPTVAPFVGRARELAVLRAAWSASRQRVVAAVVRGPSGVGKTALVHELADSLRRDEGALVATGRCFERMAIPYKAIHGIATAIAALLRADAEARAAAVATPDAGLLATVFPPFAEIEELVRAARGVPPVRDPRHLRERVFEAFRAVIRGLAARGPLVIVIDDLQWADGDGLRLLEHVVSGSGPPFLLLAVARETDLPGEAAWLTAPEVVRLALGPLAEGDAEELALALAGEPARAGAIAAEAKGHPLHIAELVRHRDGGASPGAAPRLDEVIAARVRALPREQARVLELVSLTGAPLPQRLVRDAATIDGAAFWAALGSLRAAHLIRTHGPADDDAIEPYHDRVREAVVGQLAADARRLGHGILAELLERDPRADDHAGTLADHWEAAGDEARAVRWVLRAAERASAGLAFDRAAELYRRALTLGRLDEAAQAEVRIRLGDALASGGRGADAAAAYLDAAGRHGGADALDLRRRAAEQLMRSGHIDRGLEIIDDVLRAVRLPTLSHRRWPLAALVVQRALLRLRRLRGPVRRGGPNAQLRLACCWSAMAGLSMVSPLGSAEYQSRYLRLALATGDARGIALGMAFEAMGAAATARTAAPAHRLLAEMERWTRDLDEPLVRAYAAVARGTVAFLTAQWRTALEHCDNAERIFRDDCIGAAWEIGSAQRVSLTCLWHLARIDELRRRVGAAMDEAERRRDLYAMTQLRTVLVPNLRLMDDRSDLARAELARAGDDLAQRGIHLQHWQHMQATALVELYAGDPMAAARHLEEKLPAMRRAFLLRVRAVRGFTHFVQGTACIAAAARGGPESARWRRRADSVRRHLDRDGELAAAALLAAGLAILSRDRAQAIHQLQIAADAFAALDMGLVGAAARWRLAELQDRHDGPGSVAAIEAEMTAQGIVCPRRVVAMLAPLPAS